MEQTIILDKTPSNHNPAKPGFFRTWWIASRPFSFPASAASVAFGATLAVTHGHTPLNIAFLVLSLVGMVMLHAAANIINDVYDFRKGVDTEVLPVSGAVVRRFLTPEEAMHGAVVLFTLGSVIGLLLALATSWLILLVGFFGLIIGILYSATAVGFKYRAMGDLCVFLDFGILGSLGSWIVQTKEFSWLPVVWAIPISLFVIAILHANNWRDISGDSAGGFLTVASLLGDKRSEVYYAFLLFGPFALVLIFMLAPRYIVNAPAMPLSFFITFLALPLAIKLMKKAVNRTRPANPFDFIALDGATAQLNLLFGALSILALILSSFGWG
jgi:1,4-dihydroxy-2-naphthoate octaprenyltransferase